jgi:hypothetical protein
MAVLFGLLVCLGTAPIQAQTGPPDPKASPVPTGNARDPQPPAPEENDIPIPRVDPFKPVAAPEPGPLSLSLAQVLRAAMEHNTDLQVAQAQQKEAY